MTFASVSKGEGPSGGLLCDCDIFMNLRLTFVWSSTMDWLHVNPNLQLRRLGVLGPENDERYFTMLVRRWELSCFNVKFFILCVAAFKLHGTVHSDVAKKIHVHLQSTCYLIWTLDIMADPQKYFSQIVRILDFYHAFWIKSSIWSRCVSCAYSQRLEKNSYKSSSPIKSWEPQESPSHLRSVTCVCLLLATVWRYLQGNLKIIISTKYTT